MPRSWRRPRRGSWASTRETWWSSGGDGAGFGRQARQRRFGRYTLLCRFASGGMANLYLARLAGPDRFEKLQATAKQAFDDPAWLEAAKDAGQPL